MTKCLVTTSIQLTLTLGISYQLIILTILMLSRKGNMILKVDRQGFVMVPKNVKKWWLSWSYLELKKAQIPRGTNSCAISYQLITPTSLMPSRKGNMILKVDRQGFLTVPISGQKVMIKMGQCHLKHGLTFARAPCKISHLIRNLASSLGIY